jgi:hypothetical protein
MRLLGEYIVASNTDDERTCHTAVEEDGEYQGTVWNSKARVCTGVRDVGPQLASAPGSITFLVEKRSYGRPDYDKVVQPNEKQTGRLLDSATPLSDEDVVYRRTMLQEQGASRCAILNGLAFGASFNQVCPRICLDPTCYSATWKTMCINECPQNEFSVDSVEYIKKCFSGVRGTKQFTTSAYPGPVSCLESECNNRSECLGVGWIQTVSYAYCEQSDAMVAHTFQQSRICHVHLLRQQSSVRMTYQRIEHFIYKKDMSYQINST